jgi:hypothetical protein
MNIKIISVLGGSEFLKRLFIANSAVSLIPDNLENLKMRWNGTAILAKE